ncbi:MAG: YciI family protein [Chloroflexi bacterium]|nr:YciI family protein [Chloroflexota bacterium]MCY4248029.1 YciI family protein [Chloroflexota bacterium]
MAKFALFYVGEPQFDDPEAAKAHQQEWMAWAQELGEAAVNLGMPFSAPTRVNIDGSSQAQPKELSGMSIVKAEDMDAAVEVAKSCPFVQFAPVDVVQIYEMGG